MKFYDKKIEDVFEELSSKKEGLSEEEAEKRLEKYGENNIKAGEEISPFMIFLNQFRNALVYILMIVVLISGLLNKWIDVYVILGVIIFNAIMGFFQEYKAEKAIESLRNMIEPTARVYREGGLKEISAKKLVPGDVVLLKEGDRIPADLRFFQTKNLRTEEALLTGESIPVNKTTKKLSAKTDLGDRENMGHMGTFVAGGQGEGVVTATGEETSFGKIATDLRSIEKTKNHFEERSSTLAKQMSLFALAGFFVIFLLALFRIGVGWEGIKTFSSEFQEVFLFSSSALVSGIPEGLPAILAIVLAIGATKMAKKNAVIRKLSATETLGVTTDIITDKTGTLTQNTMTIREIILPGEEKIEVTGAGWEAEGDFYQEDNVILPLEKENLNKLLYIAAICNDAKVIRNEETKVIGDPTEAALSVLAEKAGLKDYLRESKEKRIDRHPFNSELKYSASLSVLLEEDNKKQIYVAGAPEEVIERADKILTKGGAENFTKHKKKKVLKRLEKMSGKAMRPLALAYKDTKEDKKEVIDKDVNKLILVGIVGMIDPPRPEVKEAITKAKEAGIRIIMATGDHKETAKAIAREIGIIDKKGKVLTEADLKKLSEKEFEKKINEVSVFARLTPHMKLRIAETLQKQGRVVAMTGDGVNDAPALEKADIGIAMGIKGTDVTKEASEIVLTDDNFASIIDAVEEGRIVLRNTRQASSFLVTTNFAEDLTLIGSLIIIGTQLPLLPTQILWLNLVTDGIADATLAAEPGDKDILKEKPKKKGENILNRETLVMIVFIAVLIMAPLDILVFYYFKGQGIEIARTAAFVSMGFSQLFNTFNMRSLKKSVFKIGFFKNKYLIAAVLLCFFLQVFVVYNPFFQRILSFEPINWKIVVFLFLSSSLVLWGGEIYKKIRYSN